MKLTPQQQRAKDNLRRARQAQKTARSQFDAEMEIAWRERSSRVNETFDDAVREAHRLGVPMKQMQEAYGSKDYNTLKKIVDRVTTVHETIVERMLHVDVVAPDRFVIELKNFDDWSDPASTEPGSGAVVYVRDEDGSWLPEVFTDLARAVERELWADSPLRTEVVKHIGDLPLDSDAEDVSDYEDDEVEGSWVDLPTEHHPDIY